MGETLRKTRREAGNYYENSLKVLNICVNRHVCMKIMEQREERITRESVGADSVTHCRCRVRLFRRMSLRGSLFLKLDCNLDKKARGPRKGVANPVKLLEELYAGSMSEPYHLWLYCTYFTYHSSVQTPQTSPYMQQRFSLALFCSLFSNPLK